MRATSRCLPICVLTFALGGWPCGAARATITGPEPEAPAPEQPDAERAEQLERVGELTLRGLAKFEVADFNAAIELWEQAYELLASPQLELLLANAHVAAYGVDLDAQHLRKAKLLFEHVLGQASEAERATIAGELVKVETELERIAEREARISTQAQVEHVAEVQAEQPTPTWIAFERHRSRRTLAVEVGVLGIGVGLLTTTTVALARGVAIEREGERVVAMPHTQARGERLETLLDEGIRANQLAWTSGIVGGVALLIGSSALLVTLSRRRHARGQAPSRASLAPEAGALVLKF